MLLRAGESVVLQEGAMVVDVPVGTGASSADFQVINMFATRSKKASRSVLVRMPGSKRAKFVST